MEPFDEPPVVVGHRGAPVAAPENTPASFAAAAEAGATWMELDVRLSRDGIPVVCHDPILADGSALIELTAEDLATAGVWALDAVLDAMPPGVGVDIEVKNVPGQPDFDEGERASGLVIEAIRERAGQRPWMASSFNPITVSALAEGLPDVPVGLIHLATLGAADAAEIAGEVGARVLCPEDGASGLDPEGVAAVRARGLAVLVWTVDDPDRAARLADAGVDALCTNDPATLAARLAPRGARR